MINFYSIGYYCPNFRLKIIKIKQKKAFSLSALCFSLLLFYGHKAVSQLKKPDTSRKLTDTVFQLDEVQINTGYETIPKERATGSFETVSAKMLQHNATTDVLSRLEGITASTLFIENNGAVIAQPPNTKVLHIRGMAGFLANSLPLIILDNFPYEGDVNNLNPNDISEISILKDAAASSVWGARAGGGVVVITTKKGRLNQPLKLSFTINTSIAQKPNLFYQPKMTSQEYIESERFLFSKGYYDYSFQDTYSYPYIPPVPVLLNQYRNGQIDSLSMENQIASFYGQDIRSDYSKYLYRPAVHQQYSVQASGGNQQLSYLFSAGYDDNKEHMVTAAYKRLTLRSDATFKPVEKLSLHTRLLYTHTQSDDASGGSYLQYGYAPFPIPYLSLVTAPGKVKYTGMHFQTSYMDSLRNLGYLSWEENPVDELGKSSLRISSADILVNLGADYQLLPSLTASIKYQYESTKGRTNELMTEGIFTLNDLINTFTTIEDGQIKHYLPPGDWLILTHQDFSSQQARAQLNFGQAWGKHRVDALAAAEIRNSYSQTDKNDYFGYDPQTLSFSYIDPINAYPTYLGYSTTLYYSPYFDDERNRFVSVLANAAYSYDERYIVSASARKDASNLFGVSANRRGSPFWSAGLAWNVMREEFFHTSLFQQLKFRLTYGYSGNTNNVVPAIPVISWQNPGSINQLPYASSSTPPNPSLRWERVSTFNAGIDFTILSNRLSGSLEYYVRRPNDLIASEPVDPSLGFSSLRVNSASLKVTGVDFMLHAIMLKSTQVEWTTDLLFSYNKNRVIKYFNTYTSLPTAMIAGSPMEGLDANALLAYRFKGLNHETGAPIGTLNGEETMDYAKIKSTSSLTDLVNVGPSSPPYFGSFRQSIRYQRFTASFNLLFRLGYFFRRPGMNYQFLFSDHNGNADFAKRWQKPGDETFTNVPSMYYPINSNREQFYQYSDALVEKADNIRLQEISLAYEIAGVQKLFKQLRLQANLQNLGIIWKASKSSIDPNLETNIAIPLPLQASFSLSFTL